MRLKTLKDIAVELKVPESNLRYWRDKYAEWIPHQGRGRKRRYPDKAVEVLRFVCGMAERSENADAIKEALDTDFERVIDIEPETQRNTIAEQQRRNGMLPVPQGDMLPVMDAMTRALEIMADQKSRIDHLEQRLTVLERGRRGRDRRDVADKGAGVDRIEVDQAGQVEGLRDLLKVGMGYIGRIDQALDSINEAISGQGSK